MNIREQILLNQRDYLASFMENHLHVEAEDVNSLCKDSEKATLSKAGYSEAEIAAFESVVVPYPRSDIDMG